MNDLINTLLFLCLLAILIYTPYGCIRLVDAYFCRKRWRKIAERHNLQYTPFMLWEALFDDTRGVLHGDYREMHVSFEIQSSKLMIDATSREESAQVCPKVTIEAENAITSFLPSFLKSEASDVTTKDSQFDKKFLTKGDPIIARALLSQGVREQLQELASDQENPVEPTLLLEDGHFRMTASSRKAIRKAGTMLTKIEQLIGELQLPNDPTSHDIALAERLAAQLEASTNTAVRLQLATMLCQAFSKHIEALGIADLLAAAEEPAIRWLALEFRANQSDDLGPVFAVALSDEQSKELRLNAFDFLDKKAQPQELYQMYTTCMESSTMAIRREAKKRRSKLEAVVASAAGGMLSLNEDEPEEGQLSIAEEEAEGGLSIVEEDKPGQAKI